MVLLRARSLALGRSGVRPEVAEAHARAARRRPHARSSPSTARSGASGDLAPLAHCALVLLGEGQVETPGGDVVDAGEALRGAGIAPLVLDGQGGAGADQRHRRDARHARARPRRPGDAAAHGRRDRGDERRGAARHRPRLRARPAGPAPAPRPGDVSAANLRRAARRLGDRGAPPRPATRGCRTPTRCAARRRCTARRATRSAFADDGRRASSSCRPSTTPWCCPTGASSPAATSTARRSASPATSSAIALAQVGAIAERRIDRLLDAHALARPAAVPDRGPRRQPRHDDRAVHRGRDGRREPAAGDAGERRHASRPARCRRTTSRWAGPPPASCAARWRT